MRREIERLRPTSAEELVEGAALLGNGIPLIGGVVSGIALYAVSSRRWERLVDCLQSVEKELEHLKDISEDQEEIVAEVLERVIRERSQEKRGCYRNILLNAVGDESFVYEDVIEVVKLIEQLTTNHIKLLSVLHDPKKADENLGGLVTANTANMYMGSYATFLRHFFPDWGDDNLRRIWSDLDRLNILTQGFPSGVGMSSTLEGLSGYVSSFGETFVNYILESDDA